MVQEFQLRVDPRTAATDGALRLRCVEVAGVAPERVKAHRVVRRSIDARQRRVMVNLTVRVWIDESPDSTSVVRPEKYDVLPEGAPQAVVVGAGPAGLFAALRLIQEGIRPIVLERGKNVEERAADMARIARENTVDPDSNYCFGEGGAGAYSDGKLFTRSKKRGPVEKILHILAQHGAKEEILIDAHPHIGSDRLPRVVKAIRQTILRCGGEVRFSTRVERLVTADDGEGGRMVTGAVTSDGRQWDGPVILATGHSARDVYTSLMEAGIELQPKGIAVGVRLEHPQELIDRLQYHSAEGRGKYLPPAEYSMLTRVDGRAVYSFCMCPGGVIVPAATAPGELVVNGMSPSSRGGRKANSGMVVEVLPDDLDAYERFGPLKVMHFQKDIEAAFFRDAGGLQNAPAQRMTDFVSGRPSTSLPDTTYAPGIHAARIDMLLPRSIAGRLQQGFRDFNRKQPGFLTSEATLIGAETRTSSPVRIPRDRDSLQHIATKGLYPAGEGAGYAGGIVSAALDGDRCAASLAASLKNVN